jgi:hypothetical protein
MVLRGSRKAFDALMGFVFDVAVCPVRAQAALDFAFVPIPLKP